VTLAGSSKRFAAVTCAVSIPPYSRASATAFLFPLDLGRGLNKCNPIEVARLPEHEVRGDCEGLKPAVDDDVPAVNYAAPGLTRKISTTLAANSHGDDRSGLARR
jgi:hypothetical protein